MPTPQSLSRRQLHAGGVAITAGSALVPALHTGGASAAADPTTARPRALEARRAGRPGVRARNHRSGETVGYRADQRFAACSTFKGLLAARVLHDLDHHGELLNRLVPYTTADLAAGAPPTQQYVQTGLTVRALSAAAIAYSYARVVLGDVRVVWTSRGTPISIAVLTVQDTQDAVGDSQLIADAARGVARALAPGE